MNYHNEIMNIPTDTWSVLYKEGHRDARHTAAEIALKADAEIERLKEENEKYSAGMQENCQLRAEVEKLRTALERLTTDCMESDFNEHWDTFKNAEAVLAEKEDKT